MAKVKIVKQAGVLFIGKEVVHEEPQHNEGLLMFNQLELEDPRMIFSDGESISLRMCIGAPKSVLIEGKTDFSYYPEDEEFCNWYLKEASPIKGLQIVK